MTHSRPHCDLCKRPIGGEYLSLALVDGHMQVVEWEQATTHLCRRCCNDAAKVVVTLCQGYADAQWGQDFGGLIEYLQDNLAIGSPA